MENALISVRGLKTYFKADEGLRKAVDGVVGARRRSNRSRPDHSARANPSAAIRTSEICVW